MNNKFLDKVIEQIMSETRIIDNNLDVPFPPFFFLTLYLFHPVFPFFYAFSFHCKKVYSLNDKETEYVWNKYKEGITALINDKELV